VVFFIVLFCVLSVCKCVLYYCHQVWTQLQLRNISYHIYYTGCPRRNVPNFERVFLTLKYTDITQNTYIQSWTVTEIMAWQKCGFLAVPRTVPAQLTVLPVHCACPSLRVSLLPMSWLHYEWLVSSTESAVQSEMEVVHMYAHTHMPCKVVGTLRTTAALMRMFM
jgi:hypothetical protein